MTGDLVDRYRGCLLGVAAGDALGMPVEGLTADQIRECVGEVREMIEPSSDHFHCGLMRGQFTDDTEETLLLAESIIEAGYFDIETFVSRLTDWGRSWIEDPSLNRGVGLATRVAIEGMLADVSWKESGVAVPTCGSAMRTAPIGLVYHCDLDMVARYADLQSLPTHSSPAARAGSVAVAVGVALSFLGFTPQKVVEMAASSSRRIDREFSYRLSMVMEFQDLVPQDALEEIGTSPMILETVPAAFYCYLNFEPVDALVNAATGGGDTDSIASMAGALVGASQGTGWLPENWLACLEEKERIERVAMDLASAGARICGKN